MLGVEKRDKGGEEGGEEGNDIDDDSAAAGARDGRRFTGAPPNKASELIAGEAGFKDFLIRLGFVAFAVAFASAAVKTESVSEP